MHRSRSRGLFPKWEIYLAVAPGLLLFAAFKLYPAIANLFYSFTDYIPLSPKPTQWVGLKNYISLFSQADNLELLLLSFKNTMIIAFTVTIVQNILAVVFAILLNHNIKFRNLYRAIIFLPNTLGAVIQGLVWTLAFDPYNGTYSRILSSIGIHSAYFGDPNLALYLIIMIIMWANVGFAMTIYLSGLQAIPQELYEAGKIDGTSAWSEFRNITLPLISASVTVNMLICVIGSINILDIIIVTTNGGPGFSTYNLPFLVFKQIVSSTKTQGYAAAVAIVQFLVTLFFVIITQMIFRKREVEL